MPAQLTSVHVSLCLHTLRPLVIHYITCLYVCSNRPPASLHLQGERVHKEGPKDSVPEASRDSKAVLVVEEVVLEVILLELLVPEGKILVVQEVVGQVVADVSEHATTEHCRGDVPIVGKEEVGELPERRGQRDKESRRHDETVLVHGQIVVHSVEQKVQCEAGSVVRQPPGDCVSGLREDAGEEGTYSSRWNKKRCRMYSSKLQRLRPPRK
jgi:hypothetical protein